MTDLFGKALMDYYMGVHSAPLLLHNEYGSPEQIPLESYFYGPEEFSDLEIYTLQHVSGNILDIGAATGRHAYYLQQKGFNVTALDQSPTCCELMQDMGVKSVIEADILDYSAGAYDCAYSLMNGAGIAGTLNGLKQLLLHMKLLIKPEGTLLMDSTDITYLYEDQDFPGEKYFGELTFRYEYENDLGDAFGWLYIDYKAMRKIATEAGWNCQLLYEDDSSAYLAMLKQI